ncbi:MAG: threonine synthase [Planctomycetota bacterium]|jgi:threonine synthase
MKFISTRGDSDPVGIETAIESGLAPDGGLYVPESLPKIDASSVALGTSIVDLSEKVLSPFFAGSGLEQALPGICRRAFDFPIPLQELNESGAETQAYILELFHGPSSAFKDVGARFLAECMTVLQDSGLTRILVATSGDTGGAVAAAFYRRPGFEVVILFPEDGVSKEQRQQLTCWGENVRSFAVRGSFDDCQRMLKETLEAGPGCAGIRQTTANSINIARLLAQVVYYAHVAVELRDQTPCILIPSGNLGNATAAIWARAMGWPIGEIVMVTNANRTVPDYFASGEWRPRESLRTLANAMDVGAPSNMERIMHLYPEIDDLRKELRSLSVDDASIEATIRAGVERWGRVFDPHTATAISTLQSGGLSLCSPPVVIATAHPAKFRSIVEPLIGRAVDVPPAIAELESRPSLAVAIEASAAELRDLLSQPS